MSVTIYHNPHCSKSRQTLQLLRDRGIEPKVVEYLKQPPDADQLKRIIELLGTTPRELLRTSETEYRELGLDDAARSDDELIRAMAQHPRLIQRPIVIAGSKARIGRPPELVEDILP